MLKEFCAENDTNILQVLSLGIDRIELCNQLAVGGITPHMAVVEDVCKLAKEYQATVVTMIRPRGGDFVYQLAELEEMKRAMQAVISLGSDGLVLGALTSDNWLDEPALLYLLEGIDTNQIDLVFHMAFDRIPKVRQKEAIDWLCEHGFNRILTHGGPLESPIDRHIDWLKELVVYANNRLTILIGGGVTFHNCEYLANEIGVTEVHGTKIVSGV